jgi:methionine-rich copper-binding protein CopC
MNKFKRALVAVLIASLAAIALMPGVALAHAEVADSNPKDGSTVKKAPSEVWIRFAGFFGDGQPLTIADGEIKVYDACGNRVDAGETSMNTTMDTISVASGGKVAGRYVIKWSITALDGAAQKGKLTFDVTGGTACPVHKR